MKKLSPRQMKLGRKIAADIEKLESLGRVVTESEKAYCRSLVRRYTKPLPGLTSSNIVDIKLAFFRDDRDKPAAERRLIVVYWYPRSRRSLSSGRFTKVLS